MFGPIGIIRSLVSFRGLLHFRNLPRQTLNGLLHLLLFLRRGGINLYEAQVFLNLFVARELELDLSEELDYPALEIRGLSEEFINQTRPQLMFFLLQLLLCFILQPGLVFGGQSLVKLLQLPVLSNFALESQEETKLSPVNTGDVGGGELFDNLKSFFSFL